MFNVFVFNYKLYFLNKKVYLYTFLVHAFHTIKSGKPAFHSEKLCMSRSQIPTIASTPKQSATSCQDNQLYVPFSFSIIRGFHRLLTWRLLLSSKTLPCVFETDLYSQCKSNSCFKCLLIVSESNFRIICSFVSSFSFLFS